MSLTIHRADFFWADLLKQVDWYRDKAGPEVAEAYIDSVEATAGVVQNAWTRTISLSASTGACRRPFMARQKALPPPPHLLSVRRGHTDG